MNYEIAFLRSVRFYLEDAELGVDKPKTIDFCQRSFLGFADRSSMARSSTRIWRLEKYSSSFLSLA